MSLMEKKEVVLVILVLLLIPLAYAFSGSGGGYTVNIAQQAQLAAYNGSGGDYMMRITLGQVAVGNGTGGDYDVWLGYIHTLNAAPIINSVAVHTNETDSLQKAYTNNTLMCEVNVTDYDGSGSVLEINITWFRNNTAWHTDNQTFNITLGSTTYSFNTTAAGNIEPEDTKHGETWKCSARVYDGQETSAWTTSSGTYIYNARPVLDSTKATTISWNEDFSTNFSLGSYFKDIDLDTLGYFISWKSADWGGGRFNINNITITINNNTGMVALTPKFNVSGTMNLIFTATDNWTENDRGYTNTSNMTLQVGSVNDPPWASEVYIYPHSPEPIDTLECEYTYNDLENDAEKTSGTAYMWYLQNEGVGAFSLLAGETSNKLTSENFDLDDAIICSVKPMDIHNLAAKAYTNSTVTRIVSAAEGNLEANIVIGIG